MLIELQLENYRGFQRHRMPFKATTIVVGPNNVGKSTLVEALRFLSLVTNRARSLAYVKPPEWAGLPSWQVGVRPSIWGMDVNLSSLFHRYGPPPAIITATFEKEETVTVYIGPGGEVFGTMADGTGRPTISVRQAKHSSVPTISILSQVAPVDHEEKLLTKAHVQRSGESSLASQHFRNQLYHRHELFPEFQHLAESSWPGFRIRKFTWPAVPGTPLSLLVQDGDFVAEIAAMGHGLQMWLQVIWFLTRCSGDTVAILDEPDVYMHADMQCRLIPLITRRHRQVIVATHSIEILSQVDPDQVLVLNRTRKTSRFAASLPAVRRVLRQIQGAHNIQVARLWFSRRFLLLEGDDLRPLRQFHAILHPDTDHPIDAVPHVSIGGWGGWDHATRSGLVMKNAGGKTITTYCILDRDYHTDEEVEERLREAPKRGVQLHIWSRKEIENYLLEPEVIARVIGLGKRAKSGAPDATAIASEMDRIINEMRDGHLLDALATHYALTHRGEGHTAANRAARTRIAQAWRTCEGRIAIVPGKDVLSQLSGWSQKTAGVSLSAASIAHHFTRQEIPGEVEGVIRSIEECAPLQTVPGPRSRRLRRNG